MADVVVTVPKAMWREWIEEGDLPGEEARYDSHFWLGGNLPRIAPGERVYIVAHGKLRGFAPLVRVERSCELRPSVGCLLRQGAAEAVTITEPIRGFQGFRYRWWSREDERPFPNWQRPVEQPPTKEGD
ncbi:hypothetical protein LCGC14_1509350 [marine sediment metagenome]|uniref:ASCH domain-containing protein n=1 Tax=marine sediment metagenome TaxID=412755 RepID=A0A0F9J1X0_9ZZZZ